MGTAQRSAISPKVFKHKLTHTVEQENWTEDKLVEWIKTSAKGTVWFDAYPVHDSYRRYRHHQLMLWFQQRPDAMMYKLEFMLT